MTVNERLNPEAVEEIRKAILEASGNEILIIGNLDSQKKVFRIIVAACGHSEAVPALKPFLEKGDVVIHNHPSGTLFPSQADIDVASRLGEQGIGSYIIDNSVENIYVVAEPVVPKEISLLDVSVIAGYLEEKGALNRLFKDYERRESQIRMLEFVCRGFNSSDIRIAEAGTGVGKSLAYLIPAFEWVLKNDGRIVVSTATINLQQQLIEKDIPLVKKIFNKDPGTCLVKGRGNYICRNRLIEAVDELSLFEEENRDIRRIIEWAKTSKTGSRSDLSFYAKDVIWSRVCSEADACLGLRCASREECFVLNARKEAASARLLITNHHLLFADLSMRLAGSGYEDSAVLPPFQHIIFDEAHNIEKNATSFFSDQFNRFQVAKYVRRLFRHKGNKRAGLLTGLERIGGNKEKLRKARDTLKSIIEWADILNTMSLKLLGEQGHLRISSSSAISEIKEQLFEPMQSLSVSIIGLNNLLKEMFEDIDDDESLAVFECKIQLRRLVRVSDICKRFFKYKNNPGEIFWMESKKSGKGEYYTQYVITPLDIAPVMQKAVYEPFKTLIFTSATMTVNNRFDFWRKRVGFDQLDRKWSEEIFPSSFNYRDNVLLGIPKEAPLPDQPGYREFIPNFIKEVLKISEGRALILFTSYDLLQHTAAAVQKELSALGIPIMRQGEEDRSKLLNRFRKETASVLFATDSFWEGVDAPGESLEVVILSRLPFRVPTGPIFQARTEAIQERGGNPFWELSLPDAIIRLKQGFGRLIRRKSDIGAVMILDSRIVNRQYGNYFLSSLPETNTVISSAEGVINRFENFIVAVRKKTEGLS